MTSTTILNRLKALGRDNYKRLLCTNHGVREPCFGVPISELKKIQKVIKKNYQLALDLYATGNYDAMYLAGLIADDARMTREDLERWVGNAIGGSLPGATVPWVAAGSPHGWDAALDWIDSPMPHVAEAGWTTLSCLVALKKDEHLDLPALKKLLSCVKKNIHQAPDAARYGMNGFVIAVGSHVLPLSDLALQIADTIGPVKVHMAESSCEVPFAPKYIRKVADSGALGKKRKSVKC